MAGRPGDEAAVVAGSAMRAVVGMLDGPAAECPVVVRAVVVVIGVDRVLF
ncbi:hypothetical protein [Parafrankia sp. EUN1f]|nr:hypothetical protein [Parafrankia sp. EUN1f]EFC81385.1 hypothetical protein FrEUN1fDRAFT_5488 [Parafrankia sp. EUN1f]